MNFYRGHVLSVLLLLFNIHTCSLLWQIVGQTRVGTAQIQKEKGTSSLLSPTKWKSFSSGHAMKRQFQVEKEQKGNEGMQSKILHAMGLKACWYWPHLQAGHLKSDCQADVRFSKFIKKKRGDLWSKTGFLPAIWGTLLPFHSLSTSPLNQKACRKSDC